MSWLTYYLGLFPGLFLLQRDVTCKEYQKVDMIIKLQDTVILKCAYPEMGKMIQLSWEKKDGDAKHKIAVYNPKRGEKIFFPYNQSVTFLSSSISGDIKLKATAADKGLYQCSINTFPEGVLLKHIAVIDPAKFPRSRAADNRVQIVPGNIMTLSFGYPNVDSIKQLTWQRMAGEEISIIVDITPSQSFIGYDYKRRIQFIKSPDQNISLTIENVTTNDVGVYSCHIDTNNGNWTKTFDVDVEGEQSNLPPTRNHITPKVLTEAQNHPAKADIKMFLIFGAIALGSLVLVISVVTIICVWRSKKRKANNTQFQKGTTERHNQRRANPNSYTNPDVYDRPNSRDMEYQEEAIYANL
ncbi:CD226 antigen-like isoform X1 [Chiloscyllium plagiosum]|uniref:CD226 antigen-like isoform X1 n=1 Tax=Chiloscyllium plagiosum TaxID=36176 RepID=UPI001CB7F3BA|nr:CD226 antigen-like isoform X1 [Chiloscyllium plagiosum]